MMPAAAALNFTVQDGGLAALAGHSCRKRARKRPFLFGELRHSIPLDSARPAFPPRLARLPPPDPNPVLTGFAVSGGRPRALVGFLSSPGVLLFGGHCDLSHVQFNAPVDIRPGTCPIDDQSDFSHTRGVMFYTYLEIKTRSLDASAQGCRNS